MLSQPTVLLTLAVATLAMAPLLYRVVQPRASLRAGMDGFVLVAVGGLVLLHILPHAFEEAGLWAAGGLLLGIGVPVFLEHRGGAVARRAHGIALFVALGGLAVHAAVDGVALSLPASEGATALGAAVVLHRLPTGLLIWSRAQPTWGGRRALVLLGLLIVATIAGFVAGGSAIGLLEGEGLAFFQALVSGSLAHVLIHRPEASGATRPASRVAELIGASLGVLAVAGLGEAHGDGAAYASRMLLLMLEIAPAALIGLGLTGLVAQVAPTAVLRRLQPASPTLSVAAVAVSVPLLGGPLTLARVVAAGVTAWLVGWSVSRLVRESALEGRPCERPVGGWVEGLRSALRIGFVEVLDGAAPWLVAGLAIAAAVEPGLLVGLLARLPTGADVLFFPALGMPVLVGAVGATPLALAIVVAGASPGAAVAFLIAAPATSMAQASALSRSHGRGLAAGLVVAVLVLSGVAGLLVNAVVSRDSVPIHFLGEPSFGALRWVCLGVLGLALAGSLVRQGPIGFARRVLSLDSRDHGHDHRVDVGPHRLHGSGEPAQASRREHHHDR